MRERERIVVGSVLGVLILAWLGFAFHRSPAFPGSAIGSVFGIVAAVLMLLPLGYTIAKRARPSKPRISMQSWLAIHVYAGILGTVLAIIHTGHKFDSWLGIALTTVMLLVVVNGYVLRYLLAYVSREIQDTLSLLQTARGDLDHAWGVLEKLPAGMRAGPKASLLVAGLASLGLEAASGGPAAEIVRIADGVADMEFAVRRQEFLKRWFARSLALHVGLSVVLYALLALHVASVGYFGLRWLQ